MNQVEKVCLKLCEDIFCSSSLTDKIFLNYSVKFHPENENTVEVTLVTKEDEYNFVIGLPEEEVYSETDNHINNCIKCAEESKYNLKEIRIKGYTPVEFAQVNLQDLNNILEKVAEDHARCIEENNLEKKKINPGPFTVSADVKESFLDDLRYILKENSENGIDPSVFIDGVKRIEKSYEATLNSNEEFVFINGSIFHKKLFVQTSEKQAYKILNIRTDQNFPLVYDVLLTIFSFTNQEMRQKHFHELLDNYYNSLKSNFKKLCLDISKSLNLSIFEKQINEFIPRVKLEILKQLCLVEAKRTNEENGLERNYKNHIWELILEVNECILFPKFSREDCYKIVRTEIGSSEYVFLNYELIALEEREGYLGDYFKLKIEIEQMGKVRMLHLFAKYLPTYNDMAMELAVESFKKEEFYYLTLIPQLNDLGLEDITNFLPKCYFSRTDDVIVFQDMSKENYKSIPIKIPFTYDTLLMAVKQLTKMHACSILYEELLSEKMKERIRFDDRYPEYIEEKTVYKNRETLTKKTFDCAIKTFFDMLSRFPEIPTKLSMEEFKRRGQIVFDRSFEKVKKSDKFRNVLCHGDSWSSNILFKQDKDSQAIDCRLVDYQLIRYCPPGHDINFLLFMTTTKDVRRKYQSKLLEEYYSDLSNILQKYKVDLQKIYSYQCFFDSCQYMRSQGLCHAVMLLQFLLFPEEKLKQIFRDKEQVMKLLYVNRDIFVKELKNDGYYTQRIKELVEEFYEICESDSFRD